MFQESTSTGWFGNPILLLHGTWLFSKFDISFAFFIKKDCTILSFYFNRSFYKASFYRFYFLRISFFFCWISSFLIENCILCCYDAWSSSPIITSGMFKRVFVDESFNLEMSKVFRPFDFPLAWEDFCIFKRNILLMLSCVEWSDCLVISFLLLFEMYFWSLSLL